MGEVLSWLLDWYLKDDVTHKRDAGTTQPTSGDECYGTLELWLLARLIETYYPTKL